MSNASFLGSKHSAVEKNIDPPCTAPDHRVDVAEFEKQLKTFELCTREQAERGLRACRRPIAALEETAFRRELADFERCVHDRVRDEHTLTESKKIKRDESITAGAITLVVAAVLIVYMYRRDMEMDNAALILLGIALVPWLGKIVKSLEIAGTKVEFREIEKKIEQTRADMEITRTKTAAEVDALRGVGESVDIQLETALAEATRATRAIATADPLSMAPIQATPTMNELVEDYDRVRKTLKASDTRTAEMTKIWVQMRDLASTVEGFDIAEALRQEGGKRLEGYAYLYARPNPNMLHELIDSVGEVDRSGRFTAKPFEQYWGLNTIRRVLDDAPFGEVPSGFRAKLEGLRRSLSPGTDRYYVLMQILASMDRAKQDLVASGSP